MQSVRPFQPGSVRGGVVAVLSFGIVLMLAGCRFVPFCLDADSYSPEYMIEHHQYVFIGCVESIDTVAYLGRVAYFSAENDVFVLQYLLSPKELFKNQGGSACAKLWYVARSRLRDGMRSGPRINLGDTILVYGNEIHGGARVLELLEPTIYSSVESITGLLAGDTTASPNDNSREADSTLACLVLRSTELQAALDHRESTCPIIHTTDQSMHTSREYSREHIAYCDRKLSIGFLVTSDEYLEELRDAANK